MNGPSARKEALAKLVPRASVSVNLISREKSALLPTVVVWRVSRSVSRPLPLIWASWLTCGTWFNSWV